MIKFRVILVIVSLVILLSLILVPCFADVYSEPEEYAIFPFIYDYLDSLGMHNVASNQLALKLNYLNTLFNWNNFYSFKFYSSPDGRYQIDVPPWLNDDAMKLNQTWYERVNAKFYVYSQETGLSAYHDVIIEYFLDLYFEPQENRFFSGRIEMYAYDDDEHVFSAYYAFEPSISNGAIEWIDVIVDDIYVTDDEIPLNVYNYDAFIAFVLTGDTSVITDMVMPIMAYDTLSNICCSPRSFFAGYMGYVNNYLSDATDSAYDNGFSNGLSVGESNVFLGGIFGDFFKGVTDAINNTTLFVFDDTPVTLGLVFAAGIGIALFIWILKIFAGG